MSIEVDSLSLKIISEGNEASSALLGLASSLDKLASKNISLKKLSGGFATLSKAVENFRPANISSLKSVADSIEKLGSAKLPDVGAFARGIQTLSKTKIDGLSEKILDIKSALSQLNDTGLRKLIADLSVVAAKSTQVARVLRGAAKSSSTESTPSAQPSDDVKAYVDEASGSVGLLQRAYSGLWSQVSKFSHSKINDLKRDTLDANGVARGLRLTYMHVLEAVERLAKAKVDKLKVGVDTGKTDESKRSVDELKDSVNSFSSRTATKALNLLGSAAKSAAHPIRSLKNVLSKIPLVGKALNGLTSFFKLTKFRLFRMALTSIFNGVIQSFKYLYQYGGQFASSMDRISTSTKYLSNSIVAALAPAINALAPIIEIVVDKFVSFLNIINQTIATLTGASTWTKAVRYAVAYDDSLSSAASSANELKRSLMGFDEINALNDATSGGSSSGSSADVNSMFETVKNTQTLNDLKEKLEEFTGFDFDPLVGSLGNLKDAFINLFDEVKEDFSEFNAAVLKPFTKWIVETALPAAINGLSFVVNVIANYDTYVPEGQRWTESYSNANGMQVPTEFYSNLVENLGLTEILRSAFDKFFSWLENKLAGTWFGKMFGITVDEASTTVSANVELKQSGMDAFKEFMRSWDSTGGKVKITPELKRTGAALAAICQESWAQVNPTVTVDNKLKTTGEALSKTLLDGMGTPKVYVESVVMNKLSAKDFIDTAKKITLNWTPATGASGLSTALKMGSISFAARGGIVDSATLFGNTMVGEAGREAIIPLENHTEWMDGVADRIAAKLARTVSGSSNDGQMINVTVELDGRVVGQSTVKYIRDESRAGRDPLGAYI